MATAAPAQAALPDTPITIKISVNDQLKKLKLPLRDLGADVLPNKLRQLLAIKPEQYVVFERFSDSAGGYITLDPTNPQVYKTLVRAAKAKLKLRLKATVTPIDEEEQQHQNIVEPEAKNLTTPLAPLIVSTPTVPALPAQRESTAFDRRSNGSGIFEFREFREARASQQTLVDTSETPAATVVASTSPVEPKKPHVAPLHQTLPTRCRHADTLPQAWTVYCNECDVAMNDAHYHCNICDAGDYDLCEKCVAEGKMCPGPGHWLLKRFIKDGKVINSTTERVSPRNKKPVEPEVVKSIPGAFTPETKTLAEESVVMPTRTCNSCVVVRADHEFVTCSKCPDFDLCIDCHKGNAHGHHPAHAFEPASNQTVLSAASKNLLAAGRNVRHRAICDGCEKNIYGVRHKCLNCPDWDFCGSCVKDAQKTHPRHRFAALYEPIEDAHVNLTRHYGIFCDGPLCREAGQETYISGIRYKCAVCHDTDFCEACEALPTNQHNRTHPLIKFKTPVRGVTISTENEDANGGIRKLGDRSASRASYETKSASTETTPVQQANAATQVQTIADIKPTAAAPAVVPAAGPANKLPVPKPVEPRVMNATFVSETVHDGTKVSAGATFTQVWTMKNEGPDAWPAGCSVRYMGGDLMLNLHQGKIATTAEIEAAKESNVIGRDVQVGEEVAFKVTLRAPSRPGKSISYWRLMSADKVPFGHRLWCDIQVTPAAGSMPVQTTSESSMPPPSYDHSVRSYTQYQRDRIADHDFQLMLLEAQNRKRLLLEQEAERQRRTIAGPNTAEHTTYGAQLPISIGVGPHPNLPPNEAYRYPPWVTGRPTGPHPGRPNWPAPMPTPLNKDPEIARKEAARQRVESIKAKILRAREERAHAASLKPRSEAAAEKRQNLVDPLNKNTPERAERTAAAAPVPPPYFFIESQADAGSRTVRSEKKTEVVKGADEEKAETSEQIAAAAAARADLAEQVQEMEKMLQGSQMVFPKLEKESPSSSVSLAGPSSSSTSTSKGKAAYVENEDGEIEKSATPATTTTAATAAPAVAPAPVSASTESRTIRSGPSDRHSDFASPTLEDDFEYFNDDLEVLSADGEESDEEEEDGFLTDEEYDILDASDQETVASK